MKINLVSGFFCALGRFRCGTGACIPQNWVCNGQTECQDGSDETLDTCGPTATTLTSGRTTETSFTVSTKEEETTFTALTETTEVIVDDATALPNQTLSKHKFSFLGKDPQFSATRSVVA